jgi:DNA polymerase I-like protein with 3'-5' exonuclease and polymerase domains
MAGCSTSFSPRLDCRQAVIVPFCLSLLLILLQSTSAFCLGSQNTAKSMPSASLWVTNLARSTPRRVQVTKRTPFQTTTSLSTPNGLRRWPQTYARYGWKSQSRLFSSASTVAQTPDVLEGDNTGGQHLEEYRSDTASTVNGLKSTRSPLSIEDRLKALNIQSRPIPGGNWDVDDPVGWARDFGRRSPEEDARLQELTVLRPGDEGYFDVSKTEVPHVTIVRTKAQAQKVLKRLFAADPSIFHACDTEVMAIDLKSVGPVGNGYVTCASVYSGPDFDYGLGEGPGSCLWIDNLDDAAGILQEFKAWFENPRFLKVWHNYGFDRHVMWNEGIDVQGLGGDTMHMARLQDTCRSKMAKGGGYSLEALTADLLSRRKQPMKELFGVHRLRKDGSEGALVDIPPVESMQRDPESRSMWIKYSCYDAEGTWLLREELEKRLKMKPWIGNKNLWDYYFLHMRPFAEVLTDMERRGVRVNAKDYLFNVERKAREDRVHHSKIFREWAASKIGPDGLALNLSSATQLQALFFGGSENLKTKEQSETVRVVKVPRDEIPEDALHALENQSKAEAVGQKQIDGGDQTDELDQMKATQLKILCKEYGLKTAGKKDELKQRIRDHLLAPVQDKNIDDLETMPDDDLRDMLITRELQFAGTRGEMLDRLRADLEFTSGVLNAVSPTDQDGYRAVSEALEAAARKDGGGAIGEILDELNAKSNTASKYVEITIPSLGLEPSKYTTGGAPSVTADVLRALAGDPFSDPPKYGSAYENFGKEGCEALFSLCAIKSIDTMIATFLTSLQERVDNKSRVHCSLNLNTETGRLSSRGPNLQNQPALEKDTYQIRKAFEASPGNNLIVADYGQLELRLLASMTGCKSMIEAFEAGGDFHSRTAMDMFDYVKAKVDSGEALLEWDYAKGDPPKPLVKDLFASERRKAKTLNFSIAYGKTAFGLSDDWGVTLQEAEEMLKAWYKARPEVDVWQTQVKLTARNHGYTRTLMGRYRDLPEAKSKRQKFAKQAERASINTPIQGGAADIAMMAMNKINANEKLKALGWILLLQVHDEVMLEGPEETAKEAFDEVLNNMQEPWVFGLMKTAVPLLVDGSYTHKTWYDAK